MWSGRIRGPTGNGHHIDALRLPARIALPSGRDPFAHAQGTAVDVSEPLRPRGEPQSVPSPNWTIAQPIAADEHGRTATVVDSVSLAIRRGCAYYGLCWWPMAAR
jgi:hypothetical protein